MKFSTIMITCLMAWTGYAQSSSETETVPEPDQCDRYKSLYYQYLRQGMYLDARGFWLEAYKQCGGTENLNDTFFINGNAIYNNLRKNDFLDDSVKIVTVVDTMKWVFEQHLKVAPSPGLELRYAYFLVKEKDTNMQRLDTLLSNVDVLKEQTPAKYLRIYFMHLIFNKYNNAEPSQKEALKSEIFDTYLRFNRYANLALAKSNQIEDATKREKHVEDYKSLKEFISKYVQRVERDKSAVNQKLAEEFESLPEDKDLKKVFLNDYLGLMDKYEAIDLPAYSTYVYALVNLEPGTEGYRGIGKIEMDKREYGKAISAYEKALEYVTEDSLKNEVNYELATSYYAKGNYSKAFSIAKQIEGSKKGKALKLCGDCIAATANNCGESTFDRLANFWLANDYYQKAANFGENVSRQTWLDKAPDAERCFGAGVREGDEITLSCWNEKTRVRF